MSLRKLVVVLALVSFFGVSQPTSKADRAFIVTPPSQAALSAKVIVKAEVKSIEKDFAEVSAYPGATKETPKAVYRVAKLKVSETLVGAKGLTDIRIGFAPTGGDGGGLGGRRPFPGAQAPELKEGMEGYFLLVPHFEGDFYVYAGQFSTGPLLTKDPQTEKEMVIIKKIAAVLKDPVAGLKSKEKDERFYAVGILAKRYREVTSENRKEVEIGKEEAQDVLDVLIELPYLPTPSGTPTKPELFGVILADNTTKLGFKYPEIKPGQDVAKIYGGAMDEFIKANREKIVIKKWVAK